MSPKTVFVSGLTGMIGSFVGNAALGVLFTRSWVRSVLYDPTIQSSLFIEITPTRDVALSVAGLVVMGAIHGWLFQLFAPRIPGEGPILKGVMWGSVIWAMYWLPQEWFIYHSLLREPLVLNAFELALLLVGSLVEGVAIAVILARLGNDGPSQRGLGGALQ